MILGCFNIILGDPYSDSPIGLQYSSPPAAHFRLHSRRCRAPAHRLRRPVPLFVKSSCRGLVPKGDLRVQWMAAQRLLRPLRQALGRPILWVVPVVMCSTLHVRVLLGREPCSPSRSYAP